MMNANESMKDKMPKLANGKACLVETALNVANNSAMAICPTKES